MRQSLPEPYPRPSEPEPLLSRAGLSFPSCPGRDLARPPSGLCRHRSLTAPALPTTPPTCLQGTDPPPPPQGLATFLQKHKSLCALQPSRESSTLQEKHRPWLGGGGGSWGSWAPARTPATECCPRAERSGHHLRASPQHFITKT